VDDLVVEEEEGGLGWSNLAWCHRGGIII
jgi:hypothetical protein